MQSTKAVQRLFQNYLVWRLVQSKAMFIPVLGVREALLEYRAAVHGVEALPPQAQTCAQEAFNQMGYAVSRFYIDNHFNQLPGNPRDYLRQMVTSILGAFR